MIIYVKPKSQYTISINAGKALSPLALAENDFIVANAALQWIRKTLAQVKIILGIGTFQIDNIDFPALPAPAAPAINAIRVYAVTDAAFTVLETITDLGIVNRINQDTYRIAQNGSGGIIGAANAVYFTGSVGGIPRYSKARADSETTMPAIGMTTNLTAALGYAEVMIIGRLTNIKTNYVGWAEGQQLYVDPVTAGRLTNVRPTHPNVAQWIGTIEVVDATAGVILVNSQSLTGIEDGTNRNTFTIGNTLTGIKSLKFDGIIDGQLNWDSDLGTWELTAGNLKVNGIITSVSDPVQIPAFANPLTLDGTIHKNFKPGLITGAVTIDLINVTDGDAGQINIIMDGVGGYAVALGAMFTKKYGTTSIVNTANADNMISWSKSGADICYTIIQKV